MKFNSQWSLNSTTPFQMNVLPPQIQKTPSIDYRHSQSSCPSAQKYSELTVLVYPANHLSQPDIYQRHVKMLF